MFDRLRALSVVGILFAAFPAALSAQTPDGVPRLAGLLWRIETGGAVRASPIVADATVVVAGTDGVVRAFDLADGSARWQVDVNSPIIATPAAVDGSLYVVDRNNTLHALRLVDGAVRWRLETGADLPLPWGHEGWDYVAGGPRVVDGTVYFGSGGGGVYAVAAADGSVRWRFDAGARVRATPTPDVDRIYVGASDGRFHALDRQQGHSLWTFETEGHRLDAASAGFDRRQIYSSAVVANGVVYFGSRDARTYALDAASGAPRWSSEDGTSAWVIAAPMLDGERLLETRSSSTRVRAIRPADGSEIWSHPTGAAVFAPVVPLGDGYLVANGAGLLIAFDRDGREQWRYGAGTGTWSAPTVHGDRLLLGSDDGSVYLFALTDGWGPLLRVFSDPGVAARSLLGAAPSHAVITDYFVQRGYERLDADGLVPFLEARIDDGRPSAVVFAVDGPNASLEGEGAGTLLRRYMAAGGRAVWLGQPPGILVRNEEGQITGVDRAVPTALLSVDHASFDTDRYPAWPTPAGRDRGLRDWRIASPRVDPGPGTIALAIDERGRIAAWERPYGPGGHGRAGAFVSLWPAFSREGLDEIRAVAEYGIYRSPANSSRDRIDRTGHRRP